MRRSPRLGGSKSSVVYTSLPFSEQALVEMQKYGLNPRIVTPTSGSPFKWTNMNGSNGACWYRYSESPNSAFISFGDFSQPELEGSGKTVRIVSNGNKTWTKTNEEEYEKFIDESEKASKNLKERSRKRALRIWKEAVKFSEQAHAYIDEKKNVHPYRIRFHEDDIEVKDFAGGPYVVIPFKNASSEIQAIQLISEADKDNKRTIGPVSECSHALAISSNEEKNQTIYIGEGYATCASVHQFVRRGDDVTIMAESCHNLLPVAKIYRNRHPNHKIVILVDNDESLAGLKGSYLAAKEVDGYLAFPDVEGITDNLTSYDFNDVHRLCRDENENASLFQDAITKHVHWKSYEAQYNSIVKQYPQPIPLKINLPELPEFDVKWLPKGLRQLCKEVSEFDSAPLAFVGTAMFMALSTAVSGSVAVLPKPGEGGNGYRDYALIPNLWGLLIGDASSGKSPTLKAAFSTIYEKNKELRKSYAVEKANMTDKKGKMDRLNSGSKVLKSVRYIARNITPESLAVELGQNPTGLTLTYDEVSTFTSGLGKQFNSGLRDLLKTGYDGLQDDDITRKSQHHKLENEYAFVDRVCVSIFANAQPDTARPIFADPKMRDGFCQRFQLNVWVPEFTRTESRGFVSSKAKERAAKIFNYVLTLNPKKVLEEVEEVEDFDKDFDINDLDKKIKPKSALDSCHIYTLDDEAYEIWHAFAEARNVAAASYKVSNPALSTHITKTDKLCASLAVLIHLGEGRKKSKHISKDILLRAIEATKYYTLHAECIYRASNEVDLSILSLAKDVVRALYEGKVTEIDGTPITKLTRSTIRHCGLSSIHNNNIGDLMYNLVGYRYLVKDDAFKDGYVFNPRTSEVLESLYDDKSF